MNETTSTCARVGAVDIVVFHQRDVGGVWLVIGCFVAVIGLHGFEVEVVVVDDVDGGLVVGRCSGGLGIL